MSNRLAELQQSIAAQAYWDEDACVRDLLSLITLDETSRAQISDDARHLIEAARAHKHERDTLDAFLEEFGLDNAEGVALMCLAESLLRIPDSETADEFIHEKLLQGDWRKHVGHSDSLFVNASIWGLLLTGKWFDFEDSIKKRQQPFFQKEWLHKVLDNMGEPVVRRCLLQAMRIMGEQYILGTTVEHALRRAKKTYAPATRFSFDALGEGARTSADADRYFAAYQNVIEKLATPHAYSHIGDAHSVSIKLSALHPRYQYRQRNRVLEELLPRVKQLCLLAKDAHIGLSIDAEEAERLDIELELFAALALDPELIIWDGLGFVLQAYQKRAAIVADWLVELAQQRGAPLCVRLVKGAYWDREVKYAQVMGLPDYTVFTRKINTDLSYIACAEKLLRNGRDLIYPQFATHNAMTIALIQHLAGKQAHELQRLHGMGQLLYEQLSGNNAVRVYAPIGTHKELLPYLVRRLLENGANSSFVNRFLNQSVPAETLAEDVIDQVVNNHHTRHSRILLPRKLLSFRLNSRGAELDNPETAGAMLRAIQEEKDNAAVVSIGPIINGEPHFDSNATPAVSPNPAHSQQIVVQMIESDATHVDLAFSNASAFQPTWNQLGGEARAVLLEKVADELETQRLQFIATIVREAGRTLVDAEAEVREAVDFCRYYAYQARQHFAQPQTLEGPTGESNLLSWHGRGVFACISPWNFPLAIFCGQVVAALAAGNTVIAKPAEQTPLIALRFIELLFKSGIPAEAVQLIPGAGEHVGPLLLGHVKLAGVCFTGSTQTAQHINRQLALRDGPIVPFIAETGGINVMLVDSTALLEQVVDDIVQSAFNSAGQRCSALRILCVQDDIFESLLTMLCGACEELQVGDPALLDTDVGPVIDQPARDTLINYLQQAKQHYQLRYEYSPQRLPADGFYVGPCILEIDHLSQVDREIFGPILHVLRFKAKQLPELIEQINRSQFGLTLGVHSRIEKWSEHIIDQTAVGNNYINRNMVGAVVGVQPFGGHGLSGTGPKAGGPHYLFRFATEKTVTTNTVATGGNAPLFNLKEENNSSED